MSFTKRQFIEQSFDELGLAGYIFDLSAEQLQSALYKLDAMLAQWNSYGIRISYPLPSSPEVSDLDEETSVPDSANMAIIKNLATILAPSYGKSVSPELKSDARTSFDMLLSWASTIPKRQFMRNTPMGSGNKPWLWSYGSFLPGPYDYIEVGKDGLLELN